MDSVEQIPLLQVAGEITDQSTKVDTLIKIVTKAYPFPIEKSFLVETLWHRSVDTDVLAGVLTLARKKLTDEMDIYSIGRFDRLVFLPKFSVGTAFILPHHEQLIEAYPKELKDLSNWVYLHEVVTEHIIVGYAKPQALRFFHLLATVWPRIASYKDLNEVIGYFRKPNESNNALWTIAKDLNRLIRLNPELDFTIESELLTGYKLIERRNLNQIHEQD